MPFWQSGDRRERSVSDQLQRLADTSVYFEPMWGNNGDDLIVMGSELALSDAGLIMVRHPSEAQHVVVKGGGYRSSGGWLDHVRRLLMDAPKAGLTILPSSFEDPRQLVSLLLNRSGETTVFARELTTYQLLTSATAGSEIDVRCDHDMAFTLARSPLVSQLRESASEDTVLIVERTDSESISTRARSLGPGWIKALLPSGLKTRIKRAARQQAARRRGPNTDLARYVLEAIPPGLQRADFPVITGDIARPDFCSFDQFVAEINRAAVVATTRLHVGILSSMLGKETYMVPGVYHKMEGVYDYSLSALPNTHLLPYRHQRRAE